MDRNQLDKSLILLGRLLQDRQDHWTLVVCGGAALLSQNLTTRVTQDVDVLALMGPSGLTASEPLPPSLLHAANLVAETLGWKNNWLNSDASELFRAGLPDGLESRLIARDYGPALKVCFIGREDQIALKLLAAAHGPSLKHLTDLKVLKPTENEVLWARGWCLATDPAQTTRESLHHILKELGLGNVH